MTDMEPDKTGWLLKYRRRQNVALREQISKEMTNMSLSGLRAVLRMIETWKGRGNE